MPGVVWPDEVGGGRGVVLVFLRIDWLVLRIDCGFSTRPAPESASP